MTQEQSPMYVLTENQRVMGAWADPIKALMTVNGLTMGQMQSILHELENGGHSSFTLNDLDKFAISRVWCEGNNIGPRLAKPNMIEKVAPRDSDHVPVIYMQTDYEAFKSFEYQCREFDETTHKTTGGFYHKSLRLRIGRLVVEVHGPIVGGDDHV